jgi:hypothetical protein
MAKASIQMRHFSWEAYSVGRGASALQSTSAVTAKAHITGKTGRDSHCIYAALRRKIVHSICVSSCTSLYHTRGLPWDLHKHLHAEDTIPSPNTRLRDRLILLQLETYLVALMLCEYTSCAGGSIVRYGFPKSIPSLENVRTLSTSNISQSTEYKACVRRWVDVH